MNKKRAILIYQLTLMGLLIMFTISCKKDKVHVPELTTNTVVNVSYTTASCGGNITKDGGATVTARGVCWSTSQTPTIEGNKATDGTGIGSFTSNISGLTANTTYYIRAYATNSKGTSYGNQLSFTTSAILAPTVTTLVVRNITQSTAICEGDITSDGGSTVTARGVCWSTSQTPTIEGSKTIDGTGIGSFISRIAELTAYTTYYVRTYATNSAGTGYGSEMSFETDQAIVFDIHGNVYRTVTIGTQIWMAKNLITTKYSDGTNITDVTNINNWLNLTIGVYSNYDTPNNSSTYGRLYNWFAAKDIRNICPTGWHVPNDEEWTTLTNYLGGQSIAGGKLKENGLIHWKSPNVGATNESGFRALPGGYRNAGNGMFLNIGYDGSWWSSSESSTNEAIARAMITYFGNVSRTNVIKANGFCIRCLRD